MSFEERNGAWIKQFREESDARWTKLFSLKTGDSKLMDLAATQRMPAPPLGWTPVVKKRRKGKSPIPKDRTEPVIPIWKPPLATPPPSESMSLPATTPPSEPIFLPATTPPAQTTPAQPTPPPAQPTTPLPSPIPHIPMETQSNSPISPLMSITFTPNTKRFIENRLRQLYRPRNISPPQDLLPPILSIIQSINYIMGCIQPILSMISAYMNSAHILYP